MIGRHIRILIEVAILVGLAVAIHRCHAAKSEMIDWRDLAVRNNRSGAVCAALLTRCVNDLSEEADTRSGRTRL